jgi:putative phosphoribosyl transferase
MTPPSFEKPQDVRIDPPGLDGILAVPSKAKGLVIFAHGSGSSRLSPRNGYVAAELRRNDLATLLLDLLSPAEEDERRNVFDIDLLSRRLVRAAQWASEHPAVRDLPVAFFGASTGAAAALVAATEPHLDVAAVVSRGGRPDLAGPALAEVRAPTLLIVGSLDGQVIQLNKQAYDQLRVYSELAIVPGAGHLFEEAGTMDEVVRLAFLWFKRWFHAAAAREHGHEAIRTDLR